MSYSRRFAPRLASILARASATVLATTALLAACSGAPNAGQDSAAKGAATANAAALHCPATPDGVVVGLATGQQLKGVKVKDCKGNDHTLDELCDSKFMWLYLVHQWCPHVKKVSTYAEQMARDYESKGVVSVHVIVQNADRELPTSDDCQSWEDDHGYNSVRLFYDPTGAIKALMPSEYTSLSAFVDEERIIKGKSNTDDETQLRASLDALVSGKDPGQRGAAGGSPGG
jgi:hypothetical protein